MRADDLKGWLRDDKCKKVPERIRWELVVRLLQVTFGEENVPEEVAWVKMVLLLKGKRGYQGIGLVEVLCKV